MNDDVIPLNEIGKIGTVKVYNQAYADKQQKRIEELEKENAGLQAQTEWHKVADGDLPKNASLVIIAYYAVDEKTVGTKEVKSLKEIVTEPCFYLDNQGWTDTSDGEPYPYLNKKGVVIAWCEIPQFKE